MRQFFSDLGRQLQGIWGRLDGAQRLVVVAVLVAAVVGLLGIVWFAGRPSYQEIYSATSPDELRDARRLLNQAGVPFITDDSGQSILVERSKIGQANAILFEGGVRSTSGARGDGGVAGLLADSDTRADILEGKARQRAEDAIRQLDGVLAVTVNATRPRRSAFRDRDRETQPRATVALRLRSGVPFEQVAKAAASQASSAVGMPMENVEVVNATTHARWRWDPDREGATGAGEFMAQQRAISDLKTQAAQMALDAVYPGKTIVSVNVELDPSWEVQTSKIIPTEALVKSDRTTKDSTDSGAPAAGAGNGSGGEPADASHRNSTSKETSDREFVTDIGERRSGKLAPEVKRMTVALLYDESLDKKNGFVPADLAKVVKSIVGWDGKRDEDAAFSVMSGAFPPEEPLVSSSGPGLGEVALGWAPTVAQILGLMLVLFFLKGLFKRPTPVRSSNPFGDLSPATTSGAADDEDDLANLSEEEQVKRLRREIERAIGQDPATLARLLESWLTEQPA